MVTVMSAVERLTLTKKECFWLLNLVCVVKSILATLGHELIIYLLDHSAEFIMNISHSHFVYVNGK